VGGKSISIVDFMVVSVIGAASLCTITFS